MDQLQQYKLLDCQIHYHVQNLAKFARSLAEKKEDDSHTNLQYDDLSAALFTHWVVMDNTQYRLELNLNHKVYQLRNWDMMVEESFPVNKHSEIEIGAYLQKRFQKEGLFEPLHFTIPDYDSALKAQTFDEDTWRNWKTVRAMANEACQDFIRFFQKDAVPRIWPHHFDTGIYFSATASVGIGFGLAMADENIDAPYFYCTPYGLKEQTIHWDSFDALTSGEWFRSETFNSAVLRVNMDSLDGLKERLKAYSWSAINAYIKKTESGEAFGIP